MSKTKYPPLPTHIGKKSVMIDIGGKKRYFDVIDEIIHIQSDYPKKAFYLQKITFENGRRIEFRFAYYIIGKKPRMRNKWVFGQYATLIPPKDFRAIIKKAKNKGWL